ncbi:hypothetical protein LO763_26805 [Glycomyces sp. A-F 0318]|uniref:hypothetical protein n=1 Tax=Glycomyces amatae TaxID=2881355 RepID=UPI001E4E3291|nr:hypothetical protein [Glycomyces amatae]MCD0447231.1 hypothetical protein [Glycomyces amatae]
MSRRFKARSAVAAAAAGAAVAATTAYAVQFASADETAPEAAPSCVLETLPIPEGLVSTNVSGMSDDGSVIAYYALPLDQSWPDGLGAHPRLYADGAVTEVPMPGDHPRLHDVNASGTAAGYTTVDGYDVPYVWRDGELSELPAEEDGGRAHGINERGDVAGVDRRGAQDVPVVWPADGSGPVDLALPEEAYAGAAYDIGDDGTVVGAYYDGAGGSKPYLWHPDGTGAGLPAPEGVDLADISSIAMDLNGDWASGQLFAPGLGFASTGVRWNLAEGTAEMTELDYSVAVSADGTVAGHRPDVRTAAYQVGGTVFDLPGVADHGGRGEDGADEISADGSLIAGHVFVGVDDADLNVYNAVLWTCG